MAVTEVTVTSLGDLIDKVTPTEPDARTGRRRDSGVYRGDGDASWPLLTSLDKLGGVSPSHTKADLEEHILRNFIRYSRPYLSQASENEWEVLVAAQHHGLPTRLLDWTYSPLVAAHFATLNSERNCDRAVWRLDWKSVHQKFRLPELALLIQDLEHMLGGERPLTPWSLFSTADIKPFACMLEPPSLNPQNRGSVRNFHAVLGQAAVLRSVPGEKRTRLGTHQVHHSSRGNRPLSRPARSG